MILTVVAVGAGGIFLKNRISDVQSSLEEQGRAHEEATEIFRSLEREHPFEPPEGGLVEDHRARRFFRVTDHAWADMEEWAVELRDLGERMEGRSDPSVSDMAAGFRSIGRLSESRLVLARALEREGMSPAEYIWTGLALTRAYANVERTADAAVVPEENVALARRYRSELAAIDGDGPDKGAVLGIAVMWGMADLSTWRAMGLDTLHTLR